MSTLPVSAVSVALQVLRETLVFAILLGMKSYEVPVQLVCAILMDGLFDIKMGGNYYYSLIQLRCLILVNCSRWILFEYLLQTRIPEYVIKHPILYIMIRFILGLCTYFFDHRQQQPSTSVIRARTPHPRTGRLPLHDECIITLDHHPSNERIDELLQLYAEAANTRDTEGRLPIHILIQTGADHRDAVSRDLIRQLFRASTSYYRDEYLIRPADIDCLDTAANLLYNYPDWTNLHIAFIEVYHPILFPKDTSFHGLPPLLHSACESQDTGIHVSQEVIQEIISLNPLGAQEFTYNDEPFHEPYYIDDWLPLHTICHYGGPIENVRIIIHANREALSIPDYYGRLPIHLACQRESELNRGEQPKLDVISELVKEAPETLVSRANIMDFFNDVVFGSFTPLQILFLRSDNPNNTNGNDNINRITNLLNINPDEQGTVVDVDGLTHTDIVEHVLCKAILGKNATQDIIQQVLDDNPTCNIYKCTPVTHKSMFMYALEQLSNITSTTNHRQSSNIVSIVAYFMDTCFPSLGLLSKLLFVDYNENNKINGNGNILLCFFHFMVLGLHKHYINNNSNNNDDDDNDNHNDMPTVDGYTNNNNNDVNAENDDTVNTNSDNRNNDNSAEEDFDIGSTNILYSILRRDPNIIQTYGHYTDN